MFSLGSLIVRGGSKHSYGPGTHNRGLTSQDLNPGNRHPCLLCGLFVGKCLFGKAN